MLTTGLIRDFDRFFVGFDKVAEKMATLTDEAARATKYPPYNIKKVDDNKYLIEMAVAGFTQEDIEIETFEDKLIIKGNLKTEDSSDKTQILYQGLATRPFTRTFNLADNVEVRGAQLSNGILKVGLEAIVPEHRKPKKIEIEGISFDAASSPQLLTEKSEK